MAATLTTTPPLEQNSFARPIRKYTLEWTSHTDGTVVLGTGHQINGEIVNVVFVPSGTAAPTNLYDVTLTDAAGLDVLGGLGANLSDTNASRISPVTSVTLNSVVYPRPTVVAEEQLTLNVSNAGSAKSGTIYLYVR